MSVSLKFLKSGASAVAILGTALSFATIGSAVAQDQPAAAGATPTEEIVVTGTRIRSSNVTATEPLTVVTSAQIAETKAITLEDYIQKLPSVDFNSISQNNNNGGVGASQAAIHFLGAQRTLVLVNGLRFPGTDTQGTFAPVDLNNVPVSMVDHIEVLTDGANSIYGADAIAGVINVITKKDFNGFEADASIGGTDKGDRLSYDASATLGIGNDRGNVLINLAYSEQNPVLQRDRDWASANVGGQEAATSGRPPGLLLIDPVTGRTRYFGKSHNDLIFPDHRFNLTQVPYLVGELETKQANLSGHYDLTDDIKAVVEGFFTDRSSHERLNPDPVDFLTTTIKYPNGFILPYCLYDQGVQNANGRFTSCTFGRNPNSVRAGITDGQDQLARTRRFEGGPRNYSDTIDTYRLRIGLEGTVLNDYNWQIGYVYGASNARYETDGALNFTHLFQLAGLVPCGVDAKQGCRIANVVGDNTLTKKDVAYMEFIDTRTSQIEQDYVYGDIGGPIPFVPELPGGAVKFDVGFEYRNESTFDHPDSVIVNGDGDSNSAPTQGAYNVAAGYAEFKAPVFKDLPWVKELSVDGSVRYDYYSIFGSATTWKVNLTYAPTEDVRFRGTRATGLRAPSIKELFGGAFQNFEPIDSDPCDVALGAFAGTPSCVAALKAAGVNPATYKSSQTQIATVNQGTPTLKPEESQSWDFGLVFTPRWVPGLSLSVDYWDVYIRNTIIDGISAQSLLNDCYDPAILSAAACTAVGNRQKGTGEVVQINAPNLNFGFERTQGVDFAANYVFGASEIGIDRPGSFSVTGNAQYLIHDINLQAPGTLPADFAGTWQIVGGSEFGEPRWKALLNLGYSEDNWSVSFTERYTGGVTLFQGDPGSFGNNAPGQFYTDISGTYNYENTSITVGVDNLLDKVPPFLNDSATNSITNGGYDYVGRYMYMKVKFKFGGGEAAPVAAAPYTPPPAAAPVAAVPHSYLVFFDFNKSDLTPQATQIVDQAAANAETTKVTQLTVTGHTDTVGSDAYNMRLSRRRAESVAAELEKKGIASSEIEIVAKGKRDLLVPTADGVREPQNRRVQIVYSGGPTS
jgi:outer membrane receptor protein involved in Fe transport